MSNYYRNSGDLIRGGHLNRSDWEMWHKHYENIGYTWNVSEMAWEVK